MEQLIVMIREDLKEIKCDVKDIKTDILDLQFFKFKLIGASLGVSALVTMTINLLYLLFK